MVKKDALFTGIMPALVSCVDEDGKVMEDGMRKLMQWHMKEGVSGFYLCGGTGEGPVLQPETRMRIVEVAKATVKPGIKIIAHVGAIDLVTARKLAKHAGDTGVDAISSVPPFFFHYGEKEIYEYYHALAEESGLPVIMYASPLAGVTITREMIDKMMDIPGMLGVKWTSYDYFTMHRIKCLRNGNINVINGPDETLICGLTMGADGGIGATYNVMPKIFIDIYNAFINGNLEEAREKQYKANKLIGLLLTHGVVCGIKDILNALGYECGFQVYPQKRFDEVEQGQFHEELQAIHYFDEYL